MQKTAEPRQAAKAECNGTAHKLPKNKSMFLKQGASSKATPAPKALAKGHKKSNSNGKCPTRSAMPADNFWA